MYRIYILLQSPASREVAAGDADLTIDKGTGYFPVSLSIVNLMSGISKGNVFPRKQIK